MDRVKGRTLICAWKGFALVLQTGEGDFLMQQIAWLIYNLVQKYYRHKAIRIRAAEFWVHSRSASCPHQLHFDTDETRLQNPIQHRELPHPVSFATCNKRKSSPSCQDLADRPVALHWRQEAISCRSYRQSCFCIAVRVLDLLLSLISERVTHWGAKLGLHIL